MLDLAKATFAQILSLKHHEVCLTKSLIFNVLIKEKF